MHTVLWIGLGAVIGLTLALVYQHFMKRNPEKTGKREAGMFIMAVWALATYKFWSLTDAEMVNAFTAGWGLQTGSTFAFLAGVYGMQWYTQQHLPKENDFASDRWQRRRGGGHQADDGQYPPDNGGYGA